MARDYGGTHGSQPWNGAQPQNPGRRAYDQPSYGPPQYGPPQYPGGQPQYPGQSAHSGPEYGQSPYAGPPFPEPSRREPPDLAMPVRRRRTRWIAWALIGVGGFAALIALFGIVQGKGPRTFTATQRQQITDWEYGQRWRDLPAGVIFPASVSYSPPDILDDDPSLSLAAQRVGIANQASCATSADPAAAALLDHDGCSAMLRATYVDETDSFVVTVGAAVLPSSAKAATAAKAVATDGISSGLGPTVRALPFTGTPAGNFTDKQRQLSGAAARGTYVVLYTVGYADSRPKENVTQDSYAAAEMMSVATGVADKVLSTLAAPVPPPQCPGAGIPGC